MAMFAAPHESAPGPLLPTWATLEVVGYLGYSGRDDNIVLKAALVPMLPTWALKQVGSYLG